MIINFFIVFQAILFAIAIVNEAYLSAGLFVLFVVILHLFITNEKWRKVISKLI
jgi:hypothetical protein